MKLVNGYFPLRPNSNILLTTMRSDRFHDISLFLRNTDQVKTEPRIVFNRPRTNHNQGCPKPYWSVPVVLQILRTIFRVTDRTNIIGTATGFCPDIPVHDSFSTNGMYCIKMNVQKVFRKCRFVLWYIAGCRKLLKVTTR